MPHVVKEEGDAGTEKSSEGSAQSHGSVTRASQKRRQSTKPLRQRSPLFSFNSGRLRNPTPSWNGDRGFKGNSYRCRIRLECRR